MLDLSIRLARVQYAVLTSPNKDEIHNAALPPKSPDYWLNIIGQIFLISHIYIRYVISASEPYMYVIRRLKVKTTLCAFEILWKPCSVVATGRQIFIPSAVETQPQRPKPSFCHGISVLAAETQGWSSGRQFNGVLISCIGTFTWA